MVFARPFRLLFLCTVVFALMLALTGQAGSAQPPRITTVEPPNWWANMPKAMLLLHGEHLDGARISSSNPAVKVARANVSANGHWAEVWLDSAPDQSLALTFNITTPLGRTTVPFRFEKRRATENGFAGFSSRDVLYLVMPDRFADGDLTNDGPEGHSTASSPEAAAQRALPRGWHGGDLQGITDHLDYLQQLGITAVWLTPVTQNHEGDSYHGYGATSLYAVDEHFGTMAAYQRLADALHARGMKLVMDIVPNHVGQLHPWAADPPDPHWLHGTQAQHRVAQGDFSPLTNPHSPWRDRRDVTEGWFADILPDLDQTNPATSQYLIENVTWWVEQAGVDGLRIDTFPYVNREFWQEMHRTLHQLYPRLTSVGEIFNGDATITSAFAGGVIRTGIDTGLWTPFDFPLHFGIRNAFTGAAPMSQLAELLRADALYPRPERLVPFLDNHDTKRFLSEDGASVARQKLAMAFLLTMRGMPQLYSGDELAITGGEDPDNRHDFPGGFPATPSGAAQSAFDPATRTQPQREMFDWTQHLLHLRAREPALNSGEMQVIYTSPETIVYLRENGTRKLLVAIHRGAEDVRVRFDIAHTDAEALGTAATIFGAGAYRVQGNRATLELPADGVLIAALQP